MIIHYEKTLQNTHSFYVILDNEIISMQYYFCSKEYALNHFKQLIEA